jgi:benzoylformate decarboxylase
MTTLTGRSAFLTLLEDEGVDHLFGNPGTTELAIMEALGAHPKLHYVLGLQEAVVVAMADGYARASGRLAACNVHIAPGLGNAMGALYNAKWYGSPLIVTAGQQEQGHGLTEPMLYDPLVPIAQPMVKWAVEVARLADLPRVVHRAAKIATTPPTGPVFISLPGDILDAEEDVDLGKPTRVDVAVRPGDAAIEQLAQTLLAARNPLLLAGHELATREAWKEAAELAELLGAPVYQQTCPYAAHFPSEHAAFMGALTRSQREVRDTLKPHDLLVCLGADVLRMSVYSSIDALPEAMPIVQIGERDWELAKNYPAEIALRADVRETLRALLPVLHALRSAPRAAEAAQRLAELAARNWSAQRLRSQQEALVAAGTQPIDARWLMMRIAETLPANAVIVEEGLTSTQSLLGFFPFRDPRCYYGLASGGLGFGLPGAVGVALALPERPVVAIVGDGSAMYGIQALWTAAHLKLPITYVITNNRGYRILKERLVALRHTEKFIGMDLRDPDIDFTGLARSLGVPAQRITDPRQVAPALEAAVQSGCVQLLEVMVADGFGG